MKTSHSIGIHSAEGSKEVDLGEIPSLSGIKVLQIAAGAEHSALVTGSIFALHYICLFSVTEHSALVTGLHICLILHLPIFCDLRAYFSFNCMCVENGLVMTWGWGEHGQLGLGSTVDQTSPQVVKLEDKPPTIHSRTEAFCGSGFTFAVRHLK